MRQWITKRKPKIDETVLMLSEWDFADKQKKYIFIGKYDGKEYHRRIVKNSMGTGWEEIDNSFEKVIAWCPLSFTNLEVIGQ